ncbi:MAG TPA: PilZ domain-containing protein [Terriglobales bacterium]|nr:PilZ domain-containing protein [Terriglobales bacterium]
MKDRARRFALQLPVRYRTSGKGGWQTARTENVSCTGMLLRGAETLEPTAPVEVVLVLEMDAIGSVSTEVLCMGKVVRKVQPGGRTDLPGVAVRIDDYRFPGEWPVAQA